MLRHPGLWKWGWSQTLSGSNSTCISTIAGYHLQIISLQLFLHLAFPLTGSGIYTHTSETTAHWKSKMMYAHNHSPLSPPLRLLALLLLPLLPLLLLLLLLLMVLITSPSHNHQPNVHVSAASPTSLDTTPTPAESNRISLFLVNYVFLFPYACPHQLLQIIPNGYLQLS